MIDHDTARRSSASALDFDLDAEERGRLDDHLRACAACRAFATDLATDAAAMRELDLGPVPISVRAEIAIKAEGRERRGRGSGPVLLAAAGLLIVAAVGGVAAGVGALSGDRDRVIAPVGRAVHWTTDVVDLVAEDLWLEAAGQVMVPPDDGRIQLDSDPGDPTYWTLEVGWMAGQVEQRINLYFAADATGWRITEARIRDGRMPADWLEVSEDVAIAGAPLGAPFVGDIDIVLQDRSGPDTGPGRLVIRGLRLAVQWRGGFAPVPANPLDPNGGPLPVAPPPVVDCGPVVNAECLAGVEQLRDEVSRSHPKRTIVSILLGAGGASTVTLDDGSVIATADPVSP